MDEKQEHCLCNAKRFRDLYERLREYALHTLESPAQVYGLGVIMLRGMPAWIKAVAAYTNMQYYTNNKELRTIKIQSVERNQLEEILAVMVIQHCHKQEVS